MQDPKPPVLDVTQLAKSDLGQQRRISNLASALKGSEILKIAADIRKRIRGGAKICNLTVGDFGPQHFSIPKLLADEIHQALERGETNYPPSNGVLPLREAIVRFYERELGLRYPLESVVVASGARPLIYASFRVLVDPGETVIYPAPSWNNNHYITMVGARPAPVTCGPEHRFMPTPQALLDDLPSARLLCLNSPLNPTGTVITKDDLEGICDAILDENRAREQRGERPVYLLYDHIYWMLCFGDTRHYTPVGVRPEMARYTVFVDGISKAFAATGLRVGWGVGPVDVVSRMTAALGHFGSWAPRPEQLGVATLLDNPKAIRSYHETFKTQVQARLDLLHEHLQAFKGEGLAVDSIPPMGAIYLTVRVNPFGKRTPDGQVLQTNEHIRKYLLEAAGIGIVPFQAFGFPGDGGWFRMSVGAVGLDEIRDAMPRMAEALRALS
ncbi:MAG: pyridoxal phosphate-dependent aminotransferase [Nannocystaceae bacterium]